MKFKLSKVLAALVAVSAVATAQTGGTYDLSHNVIAGGGSKSTGNLFILEGTAGQNAAGTVSTGNGFSLRGGFWASVPLAPTAASASISGQVRTTNGNGIRNARLELTNAVTGQKFQTVTGSFGRYRFGDLTVGQTYFITIGANRFTFESSARVISLLDDLAAVDFVAVPQ
ncbi:MAG: carboxypeptidase-like regulatory domain-containing protein [Pyrinomonadaceae bacterium]